MNAVAAARPAAGITRVAALAGVAYVVLFVIGVILVFGNSPDSGSAPAKIIAYYSKGSHRTTINLGWAIGGLGIFCFLWFLTSLRGTVSRLEGGDGFLTSLTTIGGGIYAALALAALSVDTGIRTMSDDTYHHQVYPGIIHAADDASWVLHAAGGAGAAAMVIAASLAGLRAGAVSRWVGWLGVGAGILSLGLIIFFPWFVLAAWVLVVSIGMFVRGRGALAAQPIEG
jgi:hypothetical protein